ncbi:DUF2971 domain-containing protein [Polaromonas sp.]|uniref:DUF2971 domain-containing protein n=1 Tax=Polaromonas sp. TaxID=1869339 RepID=UPI0035685F26
MNDSELRDIFEKCELKDEKKDYRNYKPGTEAYKCGREEREGNSVKQFAWAKNCALNFEIDDAINHVLDSYQRGRGVEPSKVAAFEWLRKGAEQDVETLYFDLAMAYRDGEGTNKDVVKFRYWMTKAAENPKYFSEAMIQLAKAHRDPLLGKVSEKKAFELVEKMADKKVPDAMIEVALAFKTGKVVKRDLKQFLELALSAEKAALAAMPQEGVPSTEENYAFEDYPLALSTLADAYELNGASTQAAATVVLAAQAAVSALAKAKEKQAEVSGKKLPEIICEHLASFGEMTSGMTPHHIDYFEWLQKTDGAIDQTGLIEDEKVPPQALAKAIFQLSTAYRVGIGTEKNPENSGKYLEKSAQAGHPEAMYDLAMDARKKDETVSLDFSIWINRAVNAGNKDALIAKTLDECRLEKSLFEKLCLTLQSLLKQVIQIRTDRHSIPAVAKSIAHYTDSTALKSMLSAEEADKNSLRLFNVAYVNDPSEGQKLIRLKSEKFKGSLNPLQPFFTEEPNTPINPETPINLQAHDFWTFVGSFSLVQDRLDLWRAYGRDGNGFCVLTPVTAFLKKSEKVSPDKTEENTENRSDGSPLYKVCYDEISAETTLLELSVPLQELDLELKKPNYRDEHRTAIRRLVVTIISELLYLYKDKEYATEEEVRMIVALPFDSPHLKRQPKDLYEKLYIETKALR